LSIPPSTGLAAATDGVASEQSFTPGILVYQPSGATVLSPRGNVNDPNNLLGQDHPTKLTAWDILALNIAAVLNSDDDTNHGVTVTLRLVLNGGTVWQQQQAVTTVNDTPGVNYASLTFADNIPNPITVNNGAKLQLKWDAAGKLGVGSNLQLLLSAALVPAIAALTPQNVMQAAGRGAIVYQVQNVPGIRTL
jgi:hypothetical protein